MAEQVSAQERLDKIVVLIAANMVAEVCSCYVLRVDNTLELYATEGLNRDAVHRTVLSAHEGLVGLVASEATPLNLSDAQSHPAFAYRPETGEEAYHSFLGVPILRTISDSADHALPPAALVGMKPDGGVALGAILASLARNPAQLPALIRTGREAGAAFSALRRALGALEALGIGGLDLREFTLDV